VQEEDPSLALVEEADFDQDAQARLGPPALVAVRVFFETALRRDLLRRHGPPRDGQSAVLVRDEREELQVDAPHRGAELVPPDRPPSVAAQEGGPVEFPPRLHRNAGIETSQGEPDGSYMPSLAVS
jgi:hypothetical protein